MTAARSRSARPTKRYASSLGRRPKTSKRSHGATRHYQHRVRASARGSAFARFLAVPILPGFDSRGLRPGARATRAADAASRARRRRLEGEPRLRGLSGGARRVEGSFRVIDVWSNEAGTSLVSKVIHPRTRPALLKAVFLSECPKFGCVPIRNVLDPRYERVVSPTRAQRLTCAQPRAAQVEIVN